MRTPRRLFNTPLTLWALFRRRGNRVCTRHLLVHLLLILDHFRSGDPIVLGARFAPVPRHAVENAVALVAAAAVELLSAGVVDLPGLAHGRGTPCEVWSALKVCARGEVGVSGLVLLGRGMSSSIVYKESLEKMKMFQGKLIHSTRTYDTRRSVQTPPSPCL